MADLADLAEFIAATDYSRFDNLSDVIEIDAERMGGRPVLHGTRFPISQFLVELTDTSGIDEVANRYDLNAELLRAALYNISLLFTKSTQV
jgi:uncharacterized protein (DUF433 family)